MSMNNPLTPAGIEPATFRFVAQHLNHWEQNTEGNICWKEKRNKNRENTLQEDEVGGTFSSNLRAEKSIEDFM